MQHSAFETDLTLHREDAGITEAFWNFNVLGFDSKRNQLKILFDIILVEKYTKGRELSNCSAFHHINA